MLGTTVVYASGKPFSLEWEDSCASETICRTFRKIFIADRSRLQAPGIGLADA
jgi:hypothetical protein